MKRKFLFFLIVFSIFGSNLTGQDSYHFEISLKSEYFEHNVNDLVAYIVLPNVNIWGWLEVTFTSSFHHQRSTGKLVKRFEIGHNPGGYFHQQTEVPVAFGDVANIWAIGDFDHDNNRIAIYHLTSAGNSIYVRIEGLLHTSSSITSIVENTYITSPQVVSNNVQRHYTSIMQNRVGIGTLDPSSKLDINMSANGKGIQLIGENKDIDFHIGHNGTVSGFYWRYKGTQTGNNNDLELWANNVSSSDKKVYNIHQDGTINFLQNVGIGTTNPGIYKLAVEGVIGAREVVVTTDTWSDFVFEPAYKLIPLENLEQFIKRNKHLPDVPSADEIRNNGLSLGQNDAILLQKVEELTLYIIEQNKKIQNLAKEIENLKSTNK